LSIADHEKDVNNEFRSLLPQAKPDFAVREANPPCFDGLVQYVVDKRLSDTMVLLVAPKLSFVSVAPKLSLVA
jgi:hypothetical protein